MADIKDINVYQTVSSISFEVEPNTDIININKVTIIGGAGGLQNLQEVTDIGNTTTNPIIANSFVKSGGTGLNALLDDGTTVSLSSIGGATNLTTAQTISNFTIVSDTGSDASVPLGNGVLAGATINDYTTAEKNKLAGIEPNANLGVPYTGAISDVNLGEFGIQLGNLEFDNTPTNLPATAGSVYYNDADGTLDLILKGGNVTLQVGQETVIRVVNKTATSVSLLQGNYQAVRIIGAQGQRPKVDLAQATSDVLSAETIGLVTETIANNQEGFITTSGLVRGINTTGSIQGEAWADGDIIYLSPTVAGSLTKVKPQAPNHLVIIGYVIHSHIAQGTIFVKVDNGYELDEMHNVKIDTPANNNVLAYTSSTSIWENKTVESALGFTPYNATNPSGYQTASQVQAIADAKVSDTAYDETSWNGVTDDAPSKNAVRDKFFQVNTDFDDLSFALTFKEDKVNKSTSIVTDKNSDVMFPSVKSVYDWAVSLFTTASQVQTIADAKVTQTITNGVTTTAPSEDVVFDALALKANDNAVMHLAGTETITGVKTFGTNLKIAIPFNNIPTIAGIASDGGVQVLYTGTYPDQTEISYVKGVTSAIQTQLDGKVDENTAITGATKTKITYDAKGLVTAGADIATTDISDFNSASRAQTEAELVAGSNITITPSGTGATRQLTIASTGGGGGGGTQAAYTILANNTASTATPTERVYKDVAEQVYTGVPNWTVTGTAPSGATDHSYQWSQIGNLVTARLNLAFASTGSGVTAMSCPLPADMPTPKSPSGFTTANANLYYGSGLMTNARNSAPTTLSVFTSIRRDSANTGYEFFMSRGSNGPAYVYITIQYFAQ